MRPIDIDIPTAEFFRIIGGAASGKMGVYKPVPDSPYVQRDRGITAPILKVKRFPGRKQIYIGSIGFDFAFSADSLGLENRSDQQVFREAVAFIILHVDSTLKAQIVRIL